VSLVESLLDKLRFIPQLLTLSAGCAASAVFIAPIHLQLVSLVESLLDKLRFIPQPEAQERYLAGAVGAVLQQAHGRISRMLQQADLFKDFTSETSLLRVRPARSEGGLRPLLCCA
jgi:hypothetical protein